MLEVIHGKSRNAVVAAQLAEILRGCVVDGTLYIGYPILASADQTTFVEALLVTKERGPVVFSFTGSANKNEPSFWSNLQDSQDQLYFAIEANLMRHASLRRGRTLGVPLTVVSYLPDDSSPPEDFSGLVAGPRNLCDIIQKAPSLSDDLYRPLNAALQRVSTIKPQKKRTSATKQGSRGSILRQIELEIANLDQWQKRAAIETPDGPQRIRGLAGSGKTIVLALKAAYLHTQHPEWTIALTFQSRSLYQQLTELVRRFTYEHINDEPNPDKLKIVHAWGSAGRAGFYSEIANHIDHPRRDYLYGKSRFGMSRAFEGVCHELWSSVKDSDVPPLFDAVLIDEAQDLPTPFFRLVHKFTTSPKRIVWAYDELQNLSETAMSPTDELFGVNEKGAPNIRLLNVDGQPRQDIILPVCYRNSPWALTLAHALGFGIYRQEELVQHFDEPSLWSEVGYNVIEGQLAHGSAVCLKRSQNSYPEYFDQLLTADDAVTCNAFDDPIAQAEWVAANIRKNLEQDELDHDDILVVFPDSLTANRLSPAFRDALARHGIASHIAGVTTSQDQLFTSKSIAMCHIYRAKGNEAPMVYVVHCQQCSGGYELIKVRNILFTAITRSRAWIRLSGLRPGMDIIEQEFKKVAEEGYQLRFKIPTPPEMARMRMIHRDRTSTEKVEIRRAEKGLESFLKAFEDGEVGIESLPPETLQRLRKLIGGDDIDE